MLSLPVTRSASRILEVGCGGGHALELLAEREDGAEITGIDRSATQVARARQRLAALPPSTRPAVHPLSLDAAARRWSGAPFDLILAVNVNVIWTDPVEAGESLGALLAPRGRAVIGFEPPSVQGRARLQEKVRGALESTRLRLVDEHQAPSHASGAFAVVLAHHVRKARRGTPE